MKKILLIGIIVAAIFYGWTHFATPENTDSVKVKVLDEDLQATIKKPSVTLFPAATFKNASQTVSSIGSIESEQSVDIRSEVSGILNSISVKIGDQVTEGQIIARIDDSSFDIQLAQAAARVENFKAQREARIVGARDEEIKRLETAVEQAEEALAQSKLQKEQTETSNNRNLKQAEADLKKLQQRITDTQKTSNEQVKTSYENLTTTLKNNVLAINNSLVTMGNILGEKPGDETSNDAYENVLGATDRNMLRLFKQDFINLRDQLDSYSISFNTKTLTATNQEIANEANSIENYLQEVGRLLETNRNVLENTITQKGFTVTMLNGLKSEVSGKISANNAEITKLQSARQRITDTSISIDSQTENLKIDEEKLIIEINNIKEQNANRIETAINAIDIQEKSLQQSRLSLQQITASPRSIDLASIEASIKEAQAAYSLILKNKAKATITAPFSGTVASVPVKQGDLISPGAIIAALVDTDKLQIKAYISNDDRKEITIGNHASINKKYEGTVTNIAPRIDPTRKKIEIVITVDSKDPILSIGEFVEIEVMPETTSSAYLLPLKAVKISNSGNVVYTVNGAEEIVALPITIGEIYGEEIEVTSGITDETQIVGSVRGIDVGQIVEVTQ